MLAGLYRKLCMEIINYWQVQDGMCSEGLMKTKLEIPVLSAFQPELVEFYYLWKKTPGANNNRPHRRNRRQQSLRRIRNTRNTRGGQPKEADANSPAGIWIAPLGVGCSAWQGIFPAIEITIESTICHMAGTCRLTATSDTCPIATQCSGSCVRLNDVMSGVLCILEGLDSDSGLVSIHPDRFCGAPQWPHPSMG